MLLMVLVGCGPGDAETTKLKRQVAALEKRVRVLEGRLGGRAGGPMRGKAQQGKQAKRKRPTGRIEVAEGVTAFVSTGRRRMPLPASVPAGTFDLLLVVTEGEDPQKAGTITVEVGKTHQVTCSTDQVRCVVE